jgi:futalosine hydrolase
MRILLVTATAMEIAPLTAKLTPLPDPGPKQHAYSLQNHTIHTLNTGVGMVATAFWCARTLASHSYDLALNLGVCGSFDPAFPPGTAVHVTSDLIADLGAQDDQNFLDIHALGLLPKDEFPFTQGQLLNTHPPSIPILASLPKARGITVNTVHGEDSSITRTIARLNPQVESMEGAAFMYACLLSGIPFAQVRAVSNVVERRNRPAWKLRQAVDTLCDTSFTLLTQLPAIR